MEKFKVNVDSLLNMMTWLNCFSKLFEMFYIQLYFPLILQARWRIRIRVFWSDLDSVFKVRSELDPDFKKISDPVFKIWSDIDPV